MFIPGEIISILTFPGIIVHEFAHMLFCRLRRVAILDACYFRVGNPAGYIVHENSASFTTTFLISMGPFFVNTILCLLICMPAYMPISVFQLDHPFSYFLMWLGVSIGMHAVPSNQDAGNVYAQAREQMKRRNPIALISFPVIWLIYLFNLLRIVWADLIYGIAIGVGIPYLIFG
jgi:hypothetical protein